MKFHTAISFAILCLITAGARSACGDKSSPSDIERIEFQRDVQPIFAAHCYQCHGPDKQDGGIRWDRKASVLAGGDSGETAVAPGKPAVSELIRRIKSEDADEQMPPADEAKPLTADQIATLTRWIEQGAAWPESDSRQKHWAYIPPLRPDLPKVRADGWPRNAIDHFVLAQLESHGLKPSLPTDPPRLLRRVYLDLIGLPPSVDDVEEFSKDPSPAAFERIVDRLLASKRYGEKWARHWLDLARYSDSNGYQADQIREMWAYRDWVIDAMNSDMPFDQFTLEQIAGDLMPDATVAQKIATGFHRTPTCNVEAGVDPEENRTNQVIDRVNTTGTVWLGTTLECAQCHNHKYDPFTQKDYYQLFAFFNNTPLEVTNKGKGVSFDFYGPKMPVPLTPEQAAGKAHLQAEYEECERRIEETVTAAAARQVTWEGGLAAADQDAGIHVLEVAGFESAGGSKHKVLPDKSVLIGGAWPSNDTYTVTVHTELKNITGFKLEALTDPSLEGNGPGRGDRPNFVLNEFSVSAREKKTDQAAESRRIALHSAAADFSQARWDVGGAIDDDLGTGWAIAPQFGKAHFATFQTEEPVGFEKGTTLEFKLVQNYGRTRTIGRLRLSALTGGAAGVGTSPDAGIAAILKQPVQKRSAAAKKKLRDYFLGQDREIKKLRAQLERIKKQIDAIKPSTTLVMVEMDQSRSTHIFRRGEFLKKGLQVEADVPAALHAFSASSDAPRNRVGLARWLASRDNPLVARVTVNRWWEEIFGRGIVATCEDFGTQGEPPSHPKLLDWLAVEFMERGWSMKAMHKLLVMSATYQQASRATSELLERDPGNVLLARGPRFRMPAEALRDNALCISGLLANKMYGPPIFPPQPPGLWNQTGRNEPKYVVATSEDRYRRGVYVVWRRAAPYPSFINFDAPDRMKCVVQRSRTNTPLQALTLLNDEAYVECAKALAARILNDRPAAPVRERLAYGLQLCVARSAREPELDFLQHLYEQELEAFQANPNAAKSMIGKFALPTGYAAPSDVNAWAAWTSVANVLLNLDETITK